LQKGADAPPGRFDCALGGLSEQSLELGKDLLDRVEVRAVGRQEEEASAGGTNGAAHGLPLVAAEIVDDDDIAGFEGRNEHLFDIGEEAFAIDRSVNDAGRIDAVVPQGRQECQGSPMALGYLRQEFVPARCPATHARHVGFRPGLIDEDQPCRVKSALMRLPAQALSRHVGTILFGGEQSFF